MDINIAAWIGIINLIGIILVSVFNHLYHIKLTTNDLHHLSLDIKEINAEQKCIKGKFISLSEDVSYLKGTLNVPLAKRMKKTKTIK